MDESSQIPTIILTGCPSSLGCMSGATYFEQVATRWESMRQDFFGVEVRERALAVANLPEGSLALDVGAGSGFVSEALLAAGHRVMAVDASAAMVDELRRRFPGVDARVGDAMSLPMADAGVEAVFANMCLHHVEEPAHALREMARVLRPGGAVVVTDLDLHGHRFLLDEHHDRWPGFRREDVRSWFEAAGLRDVVVEDARASCCATSACGGEKARIGIFLAAGRKEARPLGGFAHCVGR